MRPPGEMEPNSRSQVMAEVAGLCTSCTPLIHSRIPREKGYVLISKSIGMISRKRALATAKSFNSPNALHYCCTY